MMMTRRSALAALAAAMPAAAWRAKSSKKLAGMRVGVPDWNLKQDGKIEAVALAAQLGFEGVEVTLGKPVDGKLPMSDGDLQKLYVEAARTAKIRIAGTCLNILHRDCLKKGKPAPDWIAAGIPITKTLAARVMLLPAFSNCTAGTEAEQDYTADLLKELAPDAERAGVTFGLENVLSAEANARILDRVKSRAVAVYYDVGNATNAGFDILKEIRWLGKQRICQVHLKDKGYLGEGKIDFRAVLDALAEIGFEGFANLETSSPSGVVDQDMRRNLAYVRKVLAEVRQA